MRLVPASCSLARLVGSDRMGKGDELDFPPGPVCWYVSALVSGLGSARGLVRVGWDRGAQTEPCQKPSIQLPPASVDGRKALTAKGKKGLPRYNNSPIFLTACTNILIGNVSKTSVAHSPKQRNTGLVSFHRGEIRSTGRIPLP